MAVFTGQGIGQALTEASYLAQDDNDLEREYYEMRSRGQPLPVRSIRSGLEQLKSGFYNTSAAMRRAVGADAAEQEASADLAQARAAGMRGNTPTLQTADSVGDYGAVAADWIFSNAPLMAGIVATGGIGGKAALLSKGAQQASRIAGTATRAARATGSAVQAERAARAASTLQKIQSRGAKAGAAVPYGSSSIGENYARIRHDPEAEGTPGEQARGAIVGGAAQTALGLYGLEKAMGAAVSKAGPLTRFGTAAGAEGATEAGEQVVQRTTHSLFNENVNLFDADARAEYLEAALAGTVVGGAYTGVFSALGAGSAADSVRAKLAAERSKAEGDDPGAPSVAPDGTPPQAPPGDQGTGLELPNEAPDQSTGPDPYAAMNEMSQEDFLRAEENRRKVLFSDTGDTNIFEQDELLYAMRALDEGEQQALASLSPEEQTDYIHLPYTGDARKRFLQVPPEERGAFVEEQQKAETWREALVQNHLNNVREAGAEAHQDTGTRYTQSIEDEQQNDQLRFTLRGDQGETLSLPSDMVSGRVMLDGVAIPQKRIWGVLEKYNYDPTTPAAKQELIETARAAKTYRSPTSTTGEPSEVMVVTHTPRTREAMQRKGVTSDLVYADELIRSPNFSRRRAQMEKDFHALRTSDPRPNAKFQAPHLARRRSNYDRERPVLGMLNTALQQQFGDGFAGIRVGEIEEDAQRSFSQEMTTEEQNSVGQRALQEHFAEMGMQPIGFADNRMFFAPRDAANAIFDAFDIQTVEDRSGDVVEYRPVDMADMSRLGSLIKRPGQQVGTFTGQAADGSSLVARGATFTNNESDGTIAIAESATERGFEQVTGVIFDQATGKMKITKGSVRNPLQIDSLVGTGVGVEGEAVNSEMSFNKAYEGEAMNLFRLNENEPSGANMSAQAALAGMADPEGFIRKMTARTSGKSAADKLSTAERKLVEEEGVPAGLLVGEQSNIKEAKRWEIPVGARSKAFGSTAMPHSQGESSHLLKTALERRFEQLAQAQGKTVEQVKQEVDETFATQFSVDPNAVLPGVALMPETNAEIAAKFKKENGYDLQVGDIVVLHREPALPNASSMMPFVYMGQSSWVNNTGNKAQRGIVVNSQETGTNAPMGLDFDGDDLIVMHPAGGFRLRGYAGGEDTTRLVQKEMLTEPMDAGGKKGVGRLAEMIVRNLLGFSQRIGDIAVLGTKLREGNVLTSTAGAAAHRRLGKKLELELETARKEGLPTEEIEKVITEHAQLLDNDGTNLVQQTENLIATIAQSSISAKKKAVLEPEAKELLKEVRKLVQSARKRRFRVPAAALAPESIQQFNRNYRELLTTYKDALEDVKRIAAEPDSSERKQERQEKAREAFFKASEAIYDANSNASQGHGTRIPLTAVHPDARKALVPTKGTKFELHRVFETAGISKKEKSNTYSGSFTVKNIVDTGDGKWKIEYGYNEKAKKPKTITITKQGHVTVKDRDGQQQHQVFFEPSALTEANRLGAIPFLSEAINSLGHTHSRDFMDHLEETGAAYNRFDERKWKAQKLAEVAKTIIDAPMSEIEAAWAEHVLTVLENDKTLGYHLGEEFRMPEDLVGIGRLYSKGIEHEAAMEAATNIPRTPLAENASPAERANRARQERLATIAATYDRTTTWLEQVSKRYNSLGVQLSELQNEKLDEGEEQQRLDVMDQRAQIKAAITTLYDLGRITDAQLLGYAPPRIAARMLTAEKIQHMRKKVTSRFDAETLEANKIDPSGASRRVFNLVDNPTSKETVFRLGDKDWGPAPGQVLPTGVYELDATLNSADQFMQDGALYLNSTATNIKGEVEKVQVKLVVPTKSRQRVSMFKYFFDQSGADKIDAAPVKSGQFRLQRIAGKDKLDSKAASSQYAVTSLKQATKTEVFVPGFSALKSSANLGFSAAFYEGIKDPQFRATVKQAHDVLANEEIRAKLHPDQRRQYEATLHNAFVAHLDRLFGKPLNIWRTAKSVFGANLIHRKGATAGGPVFYLRSLPKDAEVKKPGAEYTWHGMNIKLLPDALSVGQEGQIIDGYFQVDALEVYNAHQRGDISSRSGYAGEVGRSPHAALNPQQREMAAITTKILRAVAKQLKLPKLSLLSFEEALVIAKGQLNARETEDLKQGRKLAFYDTGSNGIYINPRLFEATGPESRAHLSYVISHELGHGLLRKHLTKVKRENPTLWKEVLDEYHAFVNEHGGVLSEGGWLGTGRVTGAQPGRSIKDSDVMRARVMASVQNHFAVAGAGVDITSFENDPVRFAEELDRLFSFEEYAADHIGRWLHVKMDQASKAEPKSEVDKFFARLADLFKRIYDATKEAFGFAPAPSIEKFMEHVLHTKSENIASQILPDINEAVDAREEKGSTKTFDKPVDQALMDWFRASKQHGLFRPGEMVEQLKQHIMTNLSKDDRALLARAAMSPSNQKQMRQILELDLEAKRALRNADDASAYLLAFHNLGLMKAGPKVQGVRNRIEKFFADIDVAANNQEGMEARAQEILKAFEQNLHASSSVIISPNAPQVKTLTKNIQKAIGKAINGFRKIYNPMLEYMSVRLQQTKIPALVELSNMVDLQSWDAEGQSAPYEQRMRLTTHTWLQRVAPIIEPLLDDTATSNMVWRIGMLRSERERAKAAWEAKQADPNSKFDKKRAEAYDVYLETQGFMRRMARYVTDGGTTLKALEDYFPWVYDVHSIAKNREDLNEYIQRPQFQGNWESLQKTLIERAEQHGDGKEARRLEHYTWQQFARQFVARLGESGVHKVDSAAAHNPGFQFEHGRALGFLMEGPKVTEADREFMLQYFEQSPSALMVKYIRSAVKRVEFERTFGTDGNKLKKLLRKAREQGATDKQIQMAIDSVDMLTGMYGGRTKDGINRIIAQMPLSRSTKEKLIDETAGATHELVRAPSQWIITYENFRLLTTNIFVNFVDPFGAMSRTGMKAWMEGQRQHFLQAWKNMPKEELEAHLAWMDRVGTTERASTYEIIMQDYYNMDMDRIPKALNRWFFKWNGSELVTTWSRGATTKAANTYIKNLAEAAKKGDKTAVKELHKLDLDISDVAFDQHGLLKMLTSEEALAAEEAGNYKALDLDFRRKDALHRITNQSTPRPGPSNRSSTLNDPNLALVGHLRSFTMAFNHSVLRRAQAEAWDNLNFLPLITLSVTFTLIMLVADWLRDYLKYGEEGAYWKRNWTWEDYVEHAMIRGGLYGKDELLMRPMESLFAGQVPKAAAETLGVTSSHLHKVGQYGLSKADLPFQDLWRNWG